MGWGGEAVHRRMQYMVKSKDKVGDPYLPITAKSATKGDFFHIFLSLIVSSSRRMLPFDV